MQIIIIGGGRSIQEGISLGLKQRLKDKFTLGTNYSYKFFDYQTALCWVDKNFYEGEKVNLKKLPLTIGNYSPFPKDYEFLPNTITLPTNNIKYTRDLSEGVYKGLCGIFSLSIAIYFLDHLPDEKKEIFLLGMDFGTIAKEGDKIINNMPVTEKDIDKIYPSYRLNQERKQYRILTHFYEDKFIHKGSSKVDYYNTHAGRAMYHWYDFIHDIKIYNVSPKSCIPNFEKIDYPSFFSKLDKELYNQYTLMRWAIAALGQAPKVKNFFKNE